MTGVRRGALAAALLGVLATAGCVTLPDGGDVRDQPGDVLPSATGIRYTPPGPARGASPHAIVTGFLDAMGASPVQTSTAREFLTRSAAEAWQPQRRTVVYDAVKPSTSGSSGDLVLTGAAWLDEAGRWRGELPAAEAHVHLRLQRERGEWRIGGVPDALLARRTWFSGAYAQFQVHFLAPDYRSLVPEPVFAPRGEPLATSLVRALLMGPPDPDAPWLANRLGGLHLAEGAVTVKEGTARVGLSGVATLPTPAARTQLAAQLAWTLRQVPGVRTFQVRIGDTPLTLEGGLTDIPVGQGASLDPADAEASTALFGLRGGRPVRVEGHDVQALDGAHAPAYALREVSVDLDATRRAEVSADGRQVRVAALDGAGPATVVTGEDFAHPAWDRAGHTWLLDRRTSGAGVTVLSSGRQLVVRVPGVSGARVTDLLVSRDGTRLFAAVRDDGRDEVLESRLWWNGDDVSASPARRVATVSGLQDLGWDGPTRVVALTTAHGLSQVTWMTLDGAPGDLGDIPAAAAVFDPVTSLVTSATPGQPLWAVGAKGALVAVGAASSADEPPHGITHLTAVG
ncbi:lipoprotein LpqB [Nocardioides phosphati]|uniref:Lipoprotein LpqB n=1 Tax=Nocardioides phosphati TaxID=1867775 RepID=A0ABQ2N6S7_9ACTN|nr:GerMN domain-containing protein [Nocardioides phosphati]GGO84728.1 lipoprotein LpqB [Nocardioides phosphati]